MGHFKFFLHNGLFSPLYPTVCIKNYYLLEVKKVHCDSVKNESAKAKKLEEGRLAPACLGLIMEPSIFL